MIRSEAAHQKALKVVVFALLLAFVGVPRGAAAQDPTDSASEAEATTRSTDVVGPQAPVEQPLEAKAPERRTLGRFFPNVGRSFIGVVSSETVFPLVIGGFASGLGSLLDDSIHESAAKNSVGDAGDFAGGPAVSLSLATGLFIGGRFAKPGRFRDMTYDLALGTLVNAGYTEVFKLAVGRERPDQSDTKSFPSGHTSHAFMAATVAREHYGWKLGAPMYALAGFVGYSRLNKDKHWFSDVLAGATLGYISGITVVRQNNKPVGAQHTVMVAPILGPHHQRGLQVAVTFR